MQECVHDHVDDQCLSETWYTPELHKAIKQGYEVLKVYEIYRFKKKISKFLNCLFTKFLKLKQEASGFCHYVPMKMVVFLNSLLMNF